MSISLLGPVECCWLMSKVHDMAGRVAYCEGLGSKSCFLGLRRNNVTRMGGP